MATRVRQMKTYSTYAGGQVGIRAHCANFTGSNWILVFHVLRPLKICRTVTLCVLRSHGHVLSCQGIQRHLEIPALPPDWARLAAPVVLSGDLPRLTKCPRRIFAAAAMSQWATAAAVRHSGPSKSRPAPSKKLYVSRPFVSLNSSCTPTPCHIKETSHEALLDNLPDGLAADCARLERKPRVSTYGKSCRPTELVVGQRMVGRRPYSHTDQP